LEYFEGAFLAPRARNPRYPGRRSWGGRSPHSIGSFLGLGIKFRWRICTLGPHGEGELVRERESL